MFSVVGEFISVDVDVVVVVVVLLKFFWNTIFHATILVINLLIFLLWYCVCFCSKGISNYSINITCNKFELYRFMKRICFVCNARVKCIEWVCLLFKVHRNRISFNWFVFCLLDSRVLSHCWKFYIILYARFMFWLLFEIYINIIIGICCTWLYANW